MPPMLMAYTICMAMYGNGAAIGMALIPQLPKPTPQELYRGRTACTAAVAGATMRGFAGVRAATTPIPAVATPTLASASFSPSKQWLILSFLLS